MKNSFTHNWMSILLAAFFSFSFNTFAQITTPRVSPHQIVKHTIGVSTIEIDYHSPGVKGRKIWGELVPYGFSQPFPNFGSGNEFPWRAGANENTIIEFSDDVKVNGSSLPAGKYGIHMIPGKEKFTIIFSSNSSSWGSFFYDKKEDVLRVETSPQDAGFTEWLYYGFDNFTKNSATAFIHWEKKKIPFKIEVDVDEVVVNNIKEDLRGSKGFGWQSWQQAANYCLNNDTHLELGLNWINTSLIRNQNFNSKVIKADILAKLNKKDESKKLMEESIAIASEIELNAYGYRLMRNNNLNGALKIFKLNIKRHPDSWNVYDSYGEALVNSGDKVKAKEYYETAREKAPDAQKKRIEGLLKKI